MVTFDIKLIQPFEVSPAMAMLTAQAIPGAERVDVSSASHTRFLTVPGAGPVEVTVKLHRDHVELSHPPAHAPVARTLIATVRRWLDLDADPAVRLERYGNDPSIGPLVRSRPGLRVIGCPDGFEAVVMCVLGQQVSVKAARTFGARAVASLGTDGTGDLRMFPTPDAMVAVTPAALQAAIGVTHARARTLHCLAGACAAGLVIDPLADPIRVRRELLALPGIGPWTVEYLAVRALGDRDAYPAGDLVLQRILGVRTPGAALAAAENWRPYRAYALFHLWSAALGI